MEGVDFARELILLLIEYPFIVSFIAGAIGAATSIFLAGMSGAGLISFWKVFVFSFLGFVFAEILWFFVGRFRIFRKLSLFSLRRGEKRVIKGLREIASKNYFASLLATKFIYGTRILSLVYLGSSGERFGKFLRVNIPAIFIWSAVLMPLGWLAGRGAVNIPGIFSNIFKFVFMILALAFLIYLIVAFLARGIYFLRQRFS